MMRSETARKKRRTPLQGVRALRELTRELETIRVGTGRAPANSSLKLDDILDESVSNGCGRHAK